jgi:hypothetical protein
MSVVSSAGVLRKAVIAALVGIVAGVTAGASSTKSELDEIHLRLNEARLLQLKLDAEELRKTSSKATR